MRPQGFLTAVKQEVTRQNAAAKWSLDEVDYKTDVLKEIAEELGHNDPQPILASGLQILEDLKQKGIILGTSVN